MADAQGGAAAGLQKLNRAVADLKLDPEAEAIMPQLIGIETAIQEANRALVQGAVGGMAAAGMSEPGPLSQAAGQFGAGMGPAPGGAMPPSFGPPPTPQTTSPLSEVQRMLG